MSAFELHGLVKRFGDVVAVDGVSLSVPAGSWFGLIGPNGAGKTTTLAMAVGLLHPDAGSASVFGVDVWSRPDEAKALLGVLPAGRFAARAPDAARAADVRRPAAPVFHARAGRRRILPTSPAWAVASRELRLWSLALTAASGQAWAWPWVLALVPALLGGGAGIAVLGSLVAPLALADDGGPTPAWSLKIHAAFPLALSPALPPAALLAAGTITDAAALRWAAVPVGIATGIGLALGFGHLATARLRRDAVALLARLDTRVGVGEEA